LSPLPLGRGWGWVKGTQARNLSL